MTSNNMILVDFKDLDIRRCPSRKRDANVKINPLARPIHDGGGFALSSRAAELSA